MTIAILATDGFEQAELTSPRDHFEKAGHQVEVLSLSGKREIRGWDSDKWGDSVRVDSTLDEADVADYDALILPGGQINPDKLRTERMAIEFIKAFAKTGKPLAAICHAPWLLIEAELVEGKTMTSFKSIRTDLRNAGANVVDLEVATADNMITSRNPDDLPAFNKAIEKALNEVHQAA